MRLLAFFLSLLAPMMAFAHGGHDHSHWSAYAVHTILAFNIFLVVLAAFLLKKKYFKVQPEEK